MLRFYTAAMSASPVSPDLQKSGMQPGFFFYPPEVHRRFVQKLQISYNIESSCKHSYS